MAGFKQGGVEFRKKSVIGEPTTGDHIIVYWNDLNDLIIKTSTGEDVIATESLVASISGNLQTQIDNLDFTYATDAILQAISGDIQNQIDNLDSGFATDAELQVVQTQVTTVSGDLDILETYTSGITGGLTQLDDRFVNVTGDTMTGDLGVIANVSITGDLTVNGAISGVSYTPPSGFPNYYYNNSPVSNIQQALDANARESFFGKHIALQQASTSVNQGGTISISGSDSITVEGGFGFHIDHTNLDGSFINPTYTKVTWSTQEATIPNISGAEYSFVYVDTADSLVKFQQIQPIPEDYRNKFLLGKVVHRDATTNFTVQLQPIGRDVYNQYSDLANAIGTVNVEGNVFSPANPSTNLTIHKTSGRSFRLNSQTGDIDNPHTTIDPIIDTDNGDTFTYVNRNGSGVVYTNSITETDPTQYDDGSGTLTSVGNKKYTIQRIYSFPKPSTGGGGNSYIFYGQAIYNNLKDAIAGIETEDFVQPATNFYDASLRGWLIMRGDITDFTDEKRFKFVTAGRFGDSGAGSSISSVVSSVFRDDLFKIENDGDPSSFLNFSLQNILDSGETITINANASQTGDIDITLPAISGQLALIGDLSDLETQTQGITGGITQINETISKSWSSLVNIWTAEPTFNINISGSGDVYDYVYDTTTYYRLVPEPYDSTQDTFYSNFNGTDTLTGVVATRGQGV